MKKIYICLLLILAVVVLFSIAALVGINHSYNQVFSRCTIDQYNTRYNITYDDIDQDKYPREQLSIRSGANILDAYLYNSSSQKGLIVISLGHRCYSEQQLTTITQFVDWGWMVLCYDYTGSFGSTGDDLVGYTQAPADLDAVLTYIEQSPSFNDLPIILYGHSLGAYATAAALQYPHSIIAAVAASGFDLPIEQWSYSVRSHTGAFGPILAPYAELLMKLKFGKKAYFSAIDGINSVSIPILLISGTTDEFYGEVSSIYVHQDKITNPNCSLILMDKENHHDHYDYFFTDAALAYQKSLSSNQSSARIDKFLFSQQDTTFFAAINSFMEGALPNN